LFTECAIFGENVTEDKVLSFFGEHSVLLMSFWTCIKNIARYQSLVHIFTNYWTTFKIFVWHCPTHLQLSTPQMRCYTTLWNLNFQKSL